MNKVVLVLIFLIFFPLINYSQSFTNIDGWIFSADYWARTELDGRDFSNKTHSPIITLMKTKFGVEKHLTNDLYFKIQLKDSRIFGNIDGDFSTANLFNQAYIKLNNFLIDSIGLKIGRFELNIGNERMFSSDDFDPIGHSFDGFILDYRTKEYSLSFFDLYTFYSKNYSFPSPDISKYPVLSENSSNIYGLWFKSDIIFNWNFYLLYLLDRNKTDFKNFDSDYFQFGGDLTYKKYNFEFSIEANAQTGKKSGKNHFAIQNSVKLLYDFDGLKIGYCRDFSSGNNPTDNTKSMAFESKFGNSYNFYGRMRYFDTLSSYQSLGIIDHKAFIHYEELENTVKLGIDYHYLSSEQKSIIDLNEFGHEIDFWISYNLNNNTIFEFGLSAFKPESLMKYLYRTAPKTYREDISYWSYIMIKVKI